MRIALCDDEAEELARLEKLVRADCCQRQLPIQLDCFLDGETLLAAGEYDIAFLDICMQGMDGMAAARQLPDCQLVFTTTSPEYAVEAFGLNAAHYLLKPLTAEAVTEAMARCLARMEEPPARIIEMKTNAGLVPLPMSHIVYAEVFNKVSVIHTEQNELQTYTSLDALLEQLDGESFLKVQRSFVVNLHYVESFLADRVVLRGGTEIMLSRSNRGELKKKYQQFLFHLARGTAI
ncbi:MAG: LytTR family DNA-binding domain-containing protein [Oscillospiraceae bacterium]